MIEIIVSSIIVGVVMFVVTYKTLEELGDDNIAVNYRIDDDGRVVMENIIKEPPNWDFSSEEELREYLDKRGERAW